jgi:hypothetical protein
MWINKIKFTDHPGKYQIARQIAHIAGFYGHKRARGCMWFGFVQHLFKSLPAIFRQAGILLSPGEMFKSYLLYIVASSS